MHTTHKKMRVTDAVRDFADMINQVCYQGKKVVLTRGNKDVAVLSPVAGQGSMTLGELLTYIINYRFDDDEAKKFVQDIADGKKLMRKHGDPWAF